MLYFITGRLGSGKSTKIKKEIAAQVRQGERDITLIVPEQNSFSTEKAMLKMLGSSGYPAVSVLSFSRLADKLIEPSRISGRTVLSESAKVALMGFALSNVRNSFQIYKNKAVTPGLVKSFLSVHGELETSCVSPEMLRETAGRVDTDILKGKLYDIALASEEYDLLRRKNYYDAADKLNLLCESIEENNSFKDKLVFIDGFGGFTALETKVIEAILKQAKAVYVTICLENPKEPDDYLFASNFRTFRKLKRIADNWEIQSAKPQNESMGSKFNNFPEEHRVVAPSLAALETNLFSPSADKYEDDASNITLCEAPDVYSECETVAVLIKKLIREEGYRCREIAVVARDSTPYEIPLRSSLNKCGLPVFEDYRRPICATPAIALVLSAVNIAAEGFSTESIMRFLKSGLTDFTEDEINAIDSYTFLWQTPGSLWLKDWVGHPRGYGADFTDDDRAELENINKIRKRIAECLDSFCKKVQSAKAEDSARAIINLLQKLNVPENLRAYSEKLGENFGEDAALQNRYWEILTKILDDFAVSAGDRVLSAKETQNILSLMLNMDTVGEIPKGIDEVTFGSADRVRLDSPKVVFVLGANYGEFPAVKAENPPFSEKDRRILLEQGLELASFGEDKIKEERFIAYISFCYAQEKLYVCRHLRSLSGETCEPCEPWVRIEELFPKHSALCYDDLQSIDFVESKQTAFEQLARQMPGKTDIYYALRQYFEGDAEYAGKIAALDRSVNVRNFEIENKDTAKDFFGKNMYISPSRAEQFFKCPFAFFCNYGLGAKPRKEATIDVLQRGTIIHYVLENLLRECPGDTLLELTKSEIAEKIWFWLNKYLDESLGGEEGKNKRFMSDYKAIGRTLGEVIDRIIDEFKVSEFRPTDFELEIGDNGDVAPYKLDLPDGGVLTVGGKVDRVDSAKVGDKDYYRIVDYKLSGKNFSLNDVFYGLNMQMLIYLFAIQADENSKYSGEKPAGVLYYPSKAPIVTVNADADEEKKQSEKNSEAKVKGIVVENTAVISAMENDARGVYIPAKITKNGAVENALSEDGFDRVHRAIDKNLINMTERLKDGRIEAFPVKTSNYYDVCKYCDYKSVCFYSDGIEIDEKEKLKRYDKDIVKMFNTGEVEI